MGEVSRLIAKMHQSRRLPLLFLVALLVAVRAQAETSDTAMDDLETRTLQALNPLPRCMASWPVMKNWLRQGFASAAPRAGPSVDTTGDRRWTRLDRLGRPLDAKKPGDAVACIQDNVTHLVWAVGLEGKGAIRRFPGGPADISTESLVQRAIAKQWCGKSDWRLPSKTQAMSLVRYSRVRVDGDGAAWRQSGFPSVGAIWTDTLAQQGRRAEERWTVSLADGYTYLESGHYQQGNSAQGRNALLVASGSCVWFNRAFVK